MIKVDDLLKIVKLTLLSGYLKNSKPLSLFVVGEAGIGKTEITTNFKNFKVSVLTDVSKMGLLDTMQKHPKMSHLIVPDFIKVTQKARNTSNDLISILNSAIEEGIGEIKLYNYHVDLKGRQIGLITSTTKESFSANRRKWKSIGFISRMIFCSFSYSEKTKDEILDYITSEKFLTKKIKENLGKFRVVDVKSPPELNKKLIALSNKKFRSQKQLQTLAKAHAISRGATEVNEEDIKEIIRLSKYLNVKFTEV